MFKRFISGEKTGLFLPSYADLIGSIKIGFELGMWNTACDIDNVLHLIANCP
jgi:hypothetical protein